MITYTDMMARVLLAAVNRETAHVPSFPAASPSLQTVTQTLVIHNNIHISALKTPLFSQFIAA